MEKDFEVIEYLKTPPNFKDLKNLLNKLKLNPVDLIRKSEKVFQEKFKGQNLTQDQWIEKIINNPILIERPIAVKGDRAIISRPPENINTLY